MLQKYTVCGASTNVNDRMCEGCYLPRTVDLGDWLYFPNMGGTKIILVLVNMLLIGLLAYSRSTSSPLNSDSSKDHEVHCICSVKEAKYIADPLIASHNLQ